MRRLGLGILILLMGGVWAFSPTGKEGRVLFWDVGMAEPLSLSEMGAKLEKNEAIRFRGMLNLWLRLTGGDRHIQVGPFSWTGKEWLWEIADKLVAYRPFEREVKLIPGRYLSQVKEDLCISVYGTENSMGCIEGGLDPWWDENIPLIGETYMVDLLDGMGLIGHRGVRAILQPIRTASDQILEDLLGVVPTQEEKERLFSLAALVEAEAAIDSERARIAGVLTNRLEKEMFLQVDASALFCWMEEGNPRPYPVLRRHLESDCPSNSYLHPGLPPVSIVLPSRMSIEAAGFPEDHDYYYYVVDGEGPNHLFSHTYKEHLENIALSRARTSP